MLLFAAVVVVWGKERVMGIAPFLFPGRLGDTATATNVASVAVGAGSERMIHHRGATSGVIIARTIWTLHEIEAQENTSFAIKATTSRKKMIKISNSKWQCNV
jgi:hypothetical protein